MKLSQWSDRVKVLLWNLQQHVMHQEKHAEQHVSFSFCPENTILLCHNESQHQKHTNSVTHHNKHVMVTFKIQETKIEVSFRKHENKAFR